MKFVFPEIYFDNVESIDFISYSTDRTDRIVNTGYTDPDGTPWSPRY